MSSIGFRIILLCLNYTYNVYGNLKFYFVLFQHRFNRKNIAFLDLSTN